MLLGDSPLLVDLIEHNLHLVMRCVLLVPKKKRGWLSRIPVFLETQFTGLCRLSRSSKPLFVLLALA